MATISIPWYFYRVWIAARYLGWIAHLGLIAAFALAFAVVLL
ncbi:hypothetical protein [Bosea sp. F3-2]|nr:hypothetical protein [Bosea sp. F3-2]